MIPVNFFVPNQTVSQAEKELRPLLFDEGCQVLSSFELNKIASLTYGDVVCDEIFELVEKIVAFPLDYTPLTIQKTLVVLKHVLIYGSEKCVNSAYGMGRFIESLTTFNTILATQQQQGATAFFQRLQGGGVDRGGPIREAATAVHQLMSNIHNLQRIRNESASKDSLVPIGDDKVAFITDNVRHILLQQRIQKQAQIEIKSNLAKSQGGWGGGYTAKDGKNVVGAAHGIEEMIKMAQRDKKKFSDSTGSNSGPSPEDIILQELLAETKRQQEEEEEARRAAAVPTEDLLGASFGPSSSSNPATAATTMDLLDFGPPAPTASNPTSTEGDLLGGFDTHAPPSSSLHDSMDLLGLSVGMQQPQNVGGRLLDLMHSSPAPPSSTISAPVPSYSQGGLLDLIPNSTTTTTVDPFATMQPQQQSLHGLYDTNGNGNHSDNNNLNGLAGMMNTMALQNNLALSKTPMLNAAEDRFAALDALASSAEGKPKVTALDAKLAETRLLSGTAPSLSAGIMHSTGSTTLGGLSSSSSSSLANAVMPGPSLLHITSPPPASSTTQDSYMSITAEVASSTLSMGLPWTAQPPPINHAMVKPGSGQVAPSYGDVGRNNNNNGHDDDNPWVMGGTVGSGLQPLGAAPATPPPPPPPPSYHG